MFRGQLYDGILIKYGGLHEKQRGIWVPTEHWLYLNVTIRFMPNTDRSLWPLERVGS